MSFVEELYVSHAPGLLTVTSLRFARQGGLLRDPHSDQAFNSDSQDESARETTTT